MNPEDIRIVEQLLGHVFNDKKLLKLSLTHASLAEARLQSNERLEFLGDSVLGMVVCEYLFRTYADLLEGDMTKIKSTVVSRRTCAIVAGDLGLEKIIRLGKGMSDRESLPKSVLAAVYESLIGALLIDGGMEVARNFILKYLEPMIESAADSGHQHNFKSVLQQASQQLMDQSPLYLVLDEKGPDHAKCFEVCVEIGIRRFKSCWGPSKKQAEQQAALEALYELGVAECSENGEVKLCRTQSKQSESPEPVSEPTPDHAS